jgi:HD-GYP domain-containing protein (c-di-GMP phosphodiesterase class II)
MLIMKSVSSKTVFACILVVLLTLAGEGYIRTSQRHTQFDMVRSGVSAILNLQAKAINDGYFTWSKLRDKVQAGDLEGARDLLSDIGDTYPLVNTFQILKGDPPEANFEVWGDGSEFNIVFGIKDDDGLNSIPGWKGQIGLSAQALIDSFQTEQRIVVDPSHGQNLVYSLKAGFESSLFGWVDFLVVVLAAIGLILPLSILLWRRNLYFYESKGLESIIFLFEQTEKISANHSRQVAALAAFIGQKLGYSQTRLRNLYTAALLHDIGKVSIPSNILLKEGPLTESELAVVKTHPVISARILKNFKELSHLSTVVLYHHERMDGSGYPEGLKGQDIPEESRVIAVVDVFEALTGDRPYREPLCVKEAMTTIRGMPLDKRIVAILEAEFGSFQDYRPPRWVVAYDRTLKKA